MPFTLAHPAVVLPFSGVVSRWGVLSALVVGTMVPDINFFVAGLTSRTYSHSIAGIVGFCVPAGLVVFAVYQALLRPMLVALLPAGFLGEIGPFPTLGAKIHWLVLVALCL